MLVQRGIDQTSHASFVIYQGYPFNNFYYHELLISVFIFGDSCYKVAEISKF